MRLRADLTLLLVAVLWGSAFAAQRIAAAAGSVFFFNGARFLLAALLLLPFALRDPLRPAQWRWMSAAGSILFLASALQQAGLRSTSAGNAGFITSMYVVLVPFVIWIGWGERPLMRAALAVAMAAFGAYLLSTEGTVAFRQGDLLEALAAVFWALHVVIAGKYAPRFAAISFSAGQLLVGGVLNLAASLAWEQPTFPLAMPVLIAIGYTAIFSLAVGYTLQIWGQRHTPPTDAAIILSLESVFAAAAGWIVLAEGFTAIRVAGCGLIMAAVLLAQTGRWGRINAPKAGLP